MERRASLFLYQCFKFVHSYSSSRTRLKFRQPEGVHIPPGSFRLFMWAGRKANLKKNSIEVGFMEGDLLFKVSRCSQCRRSQTYPVDFHLLVLQAYGRIFFSSSTGSKSKSSSRSNASRADLEEATIPSICYIATLVSSIFFNRFDFKYLVYQSSSTLYHRIQPGLAHPFLTTSSIKLSFNS